MAWADPLPGGGYRAGYRDSGGKKCYVKDADGRTVNYSRKTDARHAGAEKESSARRRAAAAAGALPATIKWGEWWDLLSAKRTFPDSDTAATERNIVAVYLRPKWGSVPLNKITFQKLDEWVNEGELRVRIGMSPGYVHRIFSVFNVSIKAALTEGVLEASPCAGIKLPKRPKKPKPYLSPTTATAYRETGKLRADVADAIDYTLETGLRPSELAGLHADRLDLERGWMLVAEVFVPGRRIIRSYPKDEDVRMVPLTDKAIEIAKRRLHGRDLGAGCNVPHSDGSSCNSTVVFLTERRRIMHPDTIAYHMKNAAERAGIERRSPYTGRRGFATRAAEGGLDAFQIAEILGHATLTQAQEYVQQTPAARVKLSAALSQYPQLVMLDGGLGQNQDHGATDGAALKKQPPRGAVIQSVRNAT
ncbi:hypothetical protein GCM10027436_02620 [Actinophytocola sediminis]